MIDGAVDVEEGKAYRIASQSSGQVLSVAEGSPEEGASILQETDEGRAHQRWRFESAGGDAYYLVAEHSGRVLAVKDGRGTDGTPIVQETRRDAESQKWTLEDAWDGSYYLLPRQNPYKALSIENSSTSSGARMVLLPFDPDFRDHRWLLEMSPTER